MRLTPVLLAALALASIACFQADTSDDGVDPLRCEDYCSAISDSCQDLDEQYPTQLACKDLCELMTPGQAGDAQGNTLECRMTWAIEAPEKQGQELAQTCRWAGPGGDGTCGGVCESFCGFAMDICTGDNAQWATATDCITDCNMLPEDPPYNTMAAGPNQSCRLYHLTLATANPVDHCPHVGGTAPCAAP